MSERQNEFERVAMPHVESLLRFARRLAANRSVAQDLVQETYLQAWRAFDRLRPDSNVRAWLFRILINTYRGEGRKSKRSLQLTPLGEGREARAASGIEESIGVLEALDTLPAEQRTVLILAAAEGFTCREVAQILSVPIGTVMSRLSRGRQSLRDALASDFQKVMR
jgi:RNA polymerase sigma-70 factor (ECF subfamily)